MSGQAAEPMRLFLSYGHPESEICQRINVLLRRGINTFGDNTLSIDHAYIRQWLQRDQPYAAPA